MKPYSDSRLRKMINASNKVEFEGRFERLKFLTSVQDEGFMLTPALALAYYEEAKLCWYHGAFVATIIIYCFNFVTLLGFACQKPLFLLL